MDVEYIAQPDIQLGQALSEMLDGRPRAIKVVFVSAFVGLQTIMRLKEQVKGLKSDGTEIRFVLGIDLRGTSQEVLREILGWEVEVRIVKHRIPGHTFHPKLYLFEWADRAIAIVGSNNITEGGFFGNYEGAVKVTYHLPDESDEFNQARVVLQRFLDPDGPTVYPLTIEFLEDLIARGEIPTEFEARIGRDVANRRRGASGREGGALFGFEDIPPPPPLPAELLERLARNRIARRRANAGTTTTGKTDSSDGYDFSIEDHINNLLPAAFYMTLPTLQGNSIPGEARIPLTAIELARDFWGWPEEYSRDESPRQGTNRTYWNWRPQWRIWNVSTPNEVTDQEVRMYMYENSSDFRFYARPLVNAGADFGDVVRIRRIAEPGGAEYECALARIGTPEHVEWEAYCTQIVRNSQRRFGYA